MKKIVSLEYLISALLGGESQTWRNNQTGTDDKENGNSWDKNPAARPSTLCLTQTVDPILLLAVMWWITLAGEKTSALRPLGVTHYNFSLKRLSDARPWFVRNLWCHYELISARIPLPCSACQALGSSARAHTAGFSSTELAKALLTSWGFIFILNCTGLWIQCSVFTVHIRNIKSVYHTTGTVDSLILCEMKLSFLPESLFSIHTG